MSSFTQICGLLGVLFGEIERRVDLVKMAQAVTDAELAAPVGANRFVVAAQAVVDNAPVIFADQLYRSLAVALLTRVIDTHAAAGTPP